MVGMPWNSFFLRGAEPCSMLIIMSSRLNMMLSLLIIMLIVLTIELVISIVRTMFLIIPCV